MTNKLRHAFYTPERINQIAVKWVKGRESDLLRTRFLEALGNFRESTYYQPDYEHDLETFAEELQTYAMDTMEEIPISLIAFLIEEIQEEER